MKKKHLLVDYITKISVFSALSIVLYYLKFPLPIFPSFLSVQFSTLPAILAGFVLGPFGGSLVVVIRFIFKLLTSRSLFLGELSDLIIGLSVVLSSSLIYKGNRSKKRAVFALIISLIIWLVFSALSNYFIIMPAYVEAFGKEAVLGMMSMVKGINEDNYLRVYVLSVVIPFNLMLGFANNLITFFVYKKVSVMFVKDFFKNKKSFLIASSGFKGSLSSLEIGKITKEELEKKGYKADYLPISDGGDGFLDSMEVIDKHSTRITCSSYDTLKREKTTTYLFCKNTKVAYIELAEVVGIKDLKNDELNTFGASTYGLGIVIKHAIEVSKATIIYLGIGGSASTDCGAGMLESLGVKFLDDDNKLITDLNNEKLSKIARIETADFNQLISTVEFHILSDVTNPLVGVKGSANVFGPQKGASPEDVFILESNICSFARVCASYFNYDYSGEPGSGAAGGVGFAGISFLKADIVSGIDYMLEKFNFKSLMKRYTDVITGEGRLDRQSLDGKVISGIIKYAPKNLHFVVGFSALDKGFEEKNNYKIHAIVPTITTLEESMSEPEKYLRKIIETEF